MPSYETTIFIWSFPPFFSLSFSFFSLPYISRFSFVILKSFILLLFFFFFVSISRSISKTRNRSFVRSFVLDVLSWMVNDRTRSTLRLPNCEWTMIHRHRLTLTREPRVLRWFDVINSACGETESRAGVCIFCFNFISTFAMLWRYILLI